ncbi:MULTISPECIES: hypothetical protein [Rhizobium]|uniref:hypothetical protein n=1 Tax=Rhizobium phaseoli TaxID=396 RepID=UPI000A1C0E83|nr:hypothetical protein [Rhizobium phaseoli]ARM12130.1 hypothetical protein Bra5_CH01893 [Rhizobium phaseoli Brasil 5]
MASVDFFDRELKLATADLEPAAINALLANFARDSVREVISSGRASETYERYVNGRQGALEDTVQAPGPIIYEFSLWEPIITFALDELRRRSPVRSGRFRSSFIVLANQRAVTDYDTIGPDAEVIITNFQPYVRKAENGLLGVKRYSIFDGAKRALASRFGNEGRNAAAYVFETRWLDVQAGVHAGMPYVLKRQGRRKDRQAGIPITYPAVVINQV